MAREPDQGPTGGLTPHIQIGDRRAAKAIAFYTKAFGAAETRRQAVDDGRLMHALLHINGASLMVHLQVDDADTWFNRAVSAGATATMPLENMFWGDRYGQVTDPFGYRWSIGHPIKEEQ